MADLYVGQKRAGTTYMSTVIDEVTAGPDMAGIYHAVEAVLPLRWVRDRSRRATWDAACGKRAPVTWWRVALDEDGTEGFTTVPWPPRVSTLPEGTSRCSACHEATGRKRPRMGFAPKGDTDG